MPQTKSLMPTMPRTGQKLVVLPGGWVAGWPGGRFCKEIYPLRDPTCNRLARLKQS